MRPMLRDAPAVEAAQWEPSTTLSRVNQRGSLGGLGGEGIDARAAEAARLQRVQQGVFINEAAPGGVDQDGVRLHFGQLRRADEVLRLRRQGQVEGDDVALGENLVGGGAG